MVLKGLYEIMESCVVGDDKFLDFAIGLRQGCVLAPLFFSLFMNVLVKGIREKVKGVQLGGSQVAMAMFADDIVLMMETGEELQMALDECTLFGWKWGLEWNTNKGKSEVMIWRGKKRPVGEKRTGVEEKVDDREWWLAGNRMWETEEYVYLGMLIGEEGIGWKARARLLEKARRQMWRMWSLVGRERGLSALGKLRVWQTMVQTILEMGGEVMRDVEWKAAEDLQIKMGKMILGTDTCNDVVRGDLGLWRVRARRWRKRLMYWRCMVNDEVAEIVKNVYEFERQRDAEGKLTWASDTRKILNKLGLSQYWWSEEKIDNRRWKKLVCESIQAFEEKEWGRRVWKNKKLRWYRRVKPKLAFEEYLQDKWTQGRRTLSRLRGGTLRLRVEEGRWEGLERAERNCEVCESKAVEDVQHFVEECTFYKRQQIFTVREMVRGGGKDNKKRWGIMKQLMSQWITRKRKMTKIMDGRGRGGRDGGATPPSE